MEKIKIAIVDDHKILRDGIRASLINKEDIEIVFEAEDGEEFLCKLKQSPVDLVILDIKMPKIDGIEVLNVIRATDEKLRVIILTMFDSESYVLKLMDMKANGYLLKNSDPQEIYHAIKKSMSTGFYFPEFVKDILVKRKLNLGNKDRVVEFEERELEVIRLICAQKTSTQIGKELFLSVRTIDGIRAKLIERTKSENTIGLIIYCFKNGVIG